jgi:hypothetical protein
MPATLGEEWNDPGAAGDRRYVEMNRPSDYSAGVWETVVEAVAHRLIWRENFWIMHAAVARALDREGRLTYEQVVELVSGSPSATSIASASREWGLTRVGVFQVTRFEKPLH